MLHLLAIPVISALIGYLTNMVAIKLLFRPQKPWRLLFWQIQGLLPKRQAQIAGSLGELVEGELFSMDDLIDKINTPQMYNLIVDRLSEVVQDRLYTIMPTIIPARVSRLIGDNLDKILRQEAPDLIRQMLEAGREYAVQEVQIKEMVENRINSFDLNQLEQIVRQVSSTEIRFIEILGGVLGFIIGLVQLGILLLFPS